MLALLLVGCAGKDWNPVFQEAKQIRATCNAKRAAGELSSYVAAEQCAGPKISALLRAEGWPYLDLDDNLQAQRLLIAEQLDRGLITTIEANARLSQLRAQAAAEQRRREHADEANAIARAALINSMLPPPSMPITCTTIGGITTCN